jgi:hypothetical protein
MSLPDLTDEAKVLHVGRMHLLNRARRDVVAKLRDHLVPLFNAMGDSRVQWSTDTVRALLDEVDAINHAIQELN